MGMSIQIELSDHDLKYFHDTLDKARNTAALETESIILGKATQLLDEIENREKFPEFVATRFKYLHTLIEMLEDKDWSLPDEEKIQVLNALAYFVDSYDLIPDDIPGIGYLDDAIMIEMVVSELSKEFKHYCEFQHYVELEKKVHPDSHPNREEWEEHNRVSMFQRMRNRRGTTGSIL